MSMSPYDSPQSRSGADPAAGYGDPGKPLPKQPVRRMPRRSVLYLGAALASFVTGVTALFKLGEGNQTGAWTDTDWFVTKTPAQIVADRLESEKIFLSEHNFDHGNGNVPNPDTLTKLDGNELLAQAKGYVVVDGDIEIDLSSDPNVLIVSYVGTVLKAGGIGPAGADGKPTGTPKRGSQVKIDTGIRFYLPPGDDWYTAVLDWPVPKGMVVPTARGIDVPGGTRPPPGVTTLPRHFDDPNARLVSVAMMAILDGNGKVSEELVYKHPVSHSQFWRIFRIDNSTDQVSPHENLGGGGFAVHPKNLGPNVESLPGCAPATTDGIIVLTDQMFEGLDRQVGQRATPELGAIPDATSRRDFLTDVTKAVRNTAAQGARDALGL